MGQLESKVKAGAALVAAFAIGGSVWFASRTTPESPEPALQLEQQAAQPARIAPSPAAAVEPQQQPDPGLPVGPNRPTPALAAPAPMPAFDSPECPDLVFVESHSVGESTLATVRHGAADPEELSVGAMLESGEVIFIGPDPQTSAPTVVFKADDGKQCRVIGPAPVAQRSFEKARVASEQARASSSEPRPFPASVRADAVMTVPTRLSGAWKNWKK
jgi:hypothetical protein